MTHARARWGLLGLLVFEAILLAFTAGSGSYTYAVTAAVGVVALAYASRAQRLTGEIPRVAIIVVALSTFARALLQTAFVGWPVPNMVSYLVPLGFALLLLPQPKPAAAVALIALARSWFIVWYFLGGSTVLVIANLVGAAAAWYWWSGEALGTSAEVEHDDAAGQ